MGTWGKKFLERYDQPLSTQEYNDLIGIINTGDPLKDFYDEYTIIDRLVLTVQHGLDAVLE